MKGSKLVMRLSSLIHRDSWAISYESLRVVLLRGFYGLIVSSAIVYFLFQKKKLPIPIAKVVSKIFFYPTFPITVLMRLGNYWTPVDNTIILGCAPMGILGHPSQLHKLGVRGVVNMCYEYQGPKDDYMKLGIKQLRLPVVDHCEPKTELYEEAIRFIKTFHDRGEKVYIHCKAGHGRGASVAYAWMLYQNQDKNPQELNAVLRQKRRVRKTLYKQKHILNLIDRLNQGSIPKTSNSSPSSPLSEESSKVK